MANPVSPSTKTNNPPVWSIALISASALAYEILLMRLFSIIHWHHFAYMIISVALLGFGASGTFLALARRRLEGRFRLVFLSSALLFGITSVVCFMLAQQVPFNALEVFWDLRQPARLLLIYLLLVIPFFCAANCICLAFLQFPDHTHRIYSFDLLGAGAGALGLIGLLYLVLPATALGLIGAVALGGALLGWLELGGRPRWLAPLIVVFILAMLLFSRLPELNISEFKGLSQALRVHNSELIDQRSSPLGLLNTVASPSVPFRHAPGLSLNSPAALPEQLAVFTDGDGLSVINAYDGRREPLEYLDYAPTALPYHLLTAPRVLVLGAGGGAEILQGIYHEARQIDAVELNPQVTGLVDAEFAGFSGSPYQSKQVTLHHREARGFVTTTDKSFDLIQVALLDSYNASASGLYALSESYLYTVEAFRDFVAQLEPGGILAITRWLKLPPRDGLKVFATAVAALEQAGVSDPGSQLITLRSWNTSTLLIGNQPFTDAQLETVREFCRQRSFDLVWYPGIKPADANRYNQLQEPWFYQAAIALLGAQREQFFEDYKFNIRPASDDRPHFFQFLKWSTLPEIISLRGRGGLPLLEWGYLLLTATLAQALLASVVLILLPLWFRRRKNDGDATNRWRIGWYFLAIGFAFMFIEIAFIQKFILFLHHPLYAIAVVLCAFLVFAGLGSMAAGNWRGKAILPLVVAGITVLALLYLVLLPRVFYWLMPLPDAARVVVSIGLLAPLAFLMGMPFPLGLSQVGKQAPDWIPWAWAVNACASVLSSVLATLLAIHLGFNMVLLLAVGLYFCAILASINRLQRPVSLH